MTEVKQRALRHVVKIVAEKKASYPSEISAFSDYDEKTVGQICRRLVEADYFETLEPKIKNSDKRLKDRAGSINGGIGKMKQRDWYALNSEINWRLKEWESNYIRNEYGDKIDVILDSEESEDRIENNFIREGVEKLEEARIL